MSIRWSPAVSRMRDWPGKHSLEVAVAEAGLPGMPGAPDGPLPPGPPDGSGEWPTRC